MNTKRLALLLTLLTAIACAGLTACTSAPEEPALKDGSPAPSAIIDPYVKIANTLSKDSMEGVVSDAVLLATAAKAVGPQAAKVDASAAALASATGMSDAREKFGDLSDAVVGFVDDLHLKLPDGVRVAICPMKRKPWMQREGEIGTNPYYGASMPGCGSFR